MMKDPYWNPAKNTARDLWFSAIDRVLTLAQGQRASGVYLPGPLNHEGSGYAARSMQAWGVEHRQAIHRQMETRDQVFLGSISHYVQEHIRLGRPRLLAAYLDFEGKVTQCDRDLLSVFSIFPAAPAGVVGVTLFAGRDMEVLRDGKRRWPCLNAVVGGAIRVEDYEHSVESWKRAVFSHSGLDALRNHPFRDAALLWRLALGMGFVSHPIQGVGEVNASAFRRLAGASAELERWTERETTDMASILSWQSTELTTLAQEMRVHLWPAALQKITYLSQGRNRMSTWFITFMRSAEGIWWQESVRELWALYLASPLVIIDKDGGTNSVSANHHFKQGGTDGRDIDGPTEGHPRPVGDEPQRHALRHR